MPRRLAPVGIAAAAALIAAGCATFNVTKQVVPEGASNGPFRVHIDCQPTTQVIPPGGEAPSDQQSQQPGSTKSESGSESESPDLTPGVDAQLNEDIIFNGPGTQLSDDYFEHSTCVITEPESAGAITVTFACTGVTPPSLASEVTCTNIPGGLQIVIGEIGDDPFIDNVLIDVLVTNDFTVPAAEPAAVLVVGPSFTG